jgi:hypothetical protein
VRASRSAADTAGGHSQASRTARVERGIGSAIAGSFTSHGRGAESIGGG